MRSTQLGFFIVVLLTQCAGGRAQAPVGSPAPAARPASPVPKPSDSSSQPSLSDAYGVPPEDAVAKARDLVKRTFAKEYFSATTPPRRAALARRLLSEARDTHDEPAVRYVLLCEARDLAAKAADAATAGRAIDLLAQHYGIAPGEMKLAALSTAAQVALTPPSQEALSRCALDAADQALSRDQYDLAGRFAHLARAAAAKLKRITLITEAEEKQKEITWAAGEFSHAKSAIETLTARPDDPHARAAAGRFKCLVKNDWEHGLPLLLDCSDEALQLLARRDQAAAAADAVAQSRIGDQWWDLGEQHVKRARLACRSRAVYWYHQAVPRLAGISRTIARKRIEEMDLLRLRELHLEPGLSGEVFGDAKFGKPFDRRADAQIDFEWPHTGRRGLPTNSFSIRWSGQLRAPTSGRYVLSILVNEGARIFIDDKPVLEELKGTQKRKATSTALNLNQGMHPIRIEFWDGGGLAKIHLFWQPPGSTDEAIIPPDAFVHEIDAGR